MILFQGKILPNDQQDHAIASLKEEIAKTLSGEPLNRETVISACAALSLRAQKGEFDAIAKPLLEMAHLSYDTYLEYTAMFAGDGLRKKVDLELAGLPLKEEQIGPHLYRRLAPLGVLMHIAAGNVDVLPAYSVIEGLLAGNINILKLPSGDKGLSVKLLSELIKAEPSLAPYIYVFDVPSYEIETMKLLAHEADAVVVWGGDAAVKGARSLAEPNCRLIEWGHKLSFAYATLQANDEQLHLLAKDICVTNQVLCSSCQGIYLDTENDEDVATFADRFFKILLAENQIIGKASLGMRAKGALSVYNERLEKKGKVYTQDGVSLIVYPDEDLALSFLFRNLWLKKLPSSRLIPVLKPYRGYLQSVALLGTNEEKERLTPLLLQAGLNRIVDGNLSRMDVGESHDGRYPLREYTKIVDIRK
jgi:hypothetical protein